MELKQILSENRIEDVSWVCSLSQSELDLLVTLKLLVLQRAKIIGHQHLAHKFNLKMLRALGLILMEYVKGRVKDLSLVPTMAEPAFMNSCNLLKCDSEHIMSIEQLQACLQLDSRKRSRKRSREEAALDQKK